MKINKEFILREVAGEFIIIPTGKNILEFNGLITVNKVGASIWEMLKEEVSLEELAKGISSEYAVEEKEARKDIREFLEILEERGILTGFEKNAE